LITHRRPRVIALIGLDTEAYSRLLPATLHREVAFFLGYLFTSAYRLVARPELSDVGALVSLVRVGSPDIVTIIQIFLRTPWLMADAKSG